MDGVCFQFIDRLQFCLKPRVRCFMAFQLRDRLSEKMSGIINLSIKVCHFGVNGGMIHEAEGKTHPDVEPCKF